MAASVYEVCKHGEKLSSLEGGGKVHTNIRVNFVGKRRPVFLVACAYGAYNKHREQTTENIKYSVSIKGHDTKECILLYHVLFGWEDLWTEYGI